MSDPNQCTPSAMDDERDALLDDFVRALNGTAMHEWSIYASAARGGLIAQHANGTRWAVQLDAWRIADV